MATKLISYQPFPPPHLLHHLQKIAIASIRRDKPRPRIMAIAAPLRLPEPRGSDIELDPLVVSWVPAEKIAETDGAGGAVVTEAVADAGVLFALFQGVLVVYALAVVVPHRDTNLNTSGSDLGAVLDDEMGGVEIGDGGSHCGGKEVLEGSREVEGLHGEEEGGVVWGRFGVGFKWMQMYYAFGEMSIYPSTPRGDKAEIHMMSPVSCTTRHA